MTSFEKWKDRNDQGNGGCADRFGPSLFFTTSLDSIVTHERSSVVSVNTFNKFFCDCKSKPNRETMDEVPGMQQLRN